MLSCRNNLDFKLYQLQQLFEPGSCWGLFLFFFTQYLRVESFIDRGTLFVSSGWNKARTWRRTRGTFCRSPSGSSRPLLVPPVSSHHSCAVSATVSTRYAPHSPTKITHGPSPSCSLSLSALTCVSHFKLLPLHSKVS